jgi:hypothetical protein
VRGEALRVAHDDEVAARARDGDVEAADVLEEAAGGEVRAR